MSDASEDRARRARHRRRRAAAAAWRRTAERSPARAGRPIEVVAVSAREDAATRTALDISGVPLRRQTRWPWPRDPEHRRVRRIDRRRGRRGQGLGRSRAPRRQACRHRQQGAARPSRRGLAALAEKNGVALNFEAAVAGGIPVVKAMRESLQGNDITRVYGILNGTCNYILTRMERGGPELCRRAEGGAGAGLCRGRSHLRHRRLRHRAQARAADQPRLRHAR